MSFAWRDIPTISKFRTNYKKGRDVSPSIFPLSANPTLDTSDMLGLDVYKRYLAGAFHETRIRNMVITGDFGIGKSSIIRSFETSYFHPRKKSGFLYISLGNFMESGVSIDDNQQNIFERRVLLQIYSRFHRKDLPASSFRLIQEHSRFSKNVISVVCGFMTAAVLLLNLHESIGGLLSANFSRIDLSAFQGSAITWLGTVLNNIDVLKSWGHMVLYLLTIAVAAVAVSFFVYHELPRLQAKALTIKASNIEASYEDAACDGYIDQHTTDIVYCLEQIADQICYTVVFEDMDRLSTEVCLKIFTRLREINYLVNLRLSRKGKYLRFVYVANNSLISHLEQSKFFDYIMPVFPCLNKKTALQILTTNLKKVNDELNSEMNTALIPSTHTTTTSGALHVIAPYLSDYRLQYTVLNEYSLLLRLHLKTNQSSWKNTDAEHILAFSVYKNLFPEDYSQIIQGKSKVFPIYRGEEFDEKSNELLSQLRGGESPLLTTNCLYFAGYSREKIIESWKTQIKSDLYNTLSSIQAEDEKEAHEALKSYCDELDESTDTAIFVAVINYIVGKELGGWDWLFSTKHTIRFVLRILSELEVGTLRLLFKSAGLDIESGKSIFEACENLSMLNQSEDFTQKELDVLCMGTGKQFSGNVWIRLEGESDSIQLKTAVSHYWECDHG